jgi:hypothetical protein
MKKNNFISLVLLISLVALLFSTCKKYPEDEFISLRTVKQRLEAEWQIQKIEINGNDVTHMYNDSLSQSIDSYRLWIDLNVKIDPNSKATDSYMYFNKCSKSKNDASDADISVIGVGYFPRKDKKIWLGSFPKKMFPVKDATESALFIRTLGDFQMWDLRKLYKSEMIWMLNTGIVTKKIIFKKTRKK